MTKSAFSERENCASQATLDETEGVRPDALLTLLTRSRVSTRMRDLCEHERAVGEMVETSMFPPDRRNKTPWHAAFAAVWVFTAVDGQ